MGSKNQLFLVTCVAITAGLIWSYSVFLGYFSEHSDDKLFLSQANKRIQAERFQRALAESRLRDLSQEVAALLPEKSQKIIAEKGYNLKSLGQVVRAPAAIPMDLSAVIFERAKKLFTEKKYPEATKEFRRLIADYPLSAHVIDSHFFVGEAAFLSGRPKDCLQSVDLMVSQYPEHELTGFLMLRLGQISEQSSHVEEASEIYQTVAKNFKNSALRDQAVRMARAVDLQ